MKGFAGDKKAAVKNWLDYNAGWLVLGIVVVWLAGSVLLDSFGKSEPDVRAAYIGRSALTDSAAAAVQTALERYCRDVNGDGQVVVELVQYEIPTLFEPAMSGILEFTQKIALAGNLEAEESELFLMEDAAAVQRNYLRLEMPDGTLPEGTDTSGESSALRWDECPALAALELDGGTSGLMVFDSDREAIMELELCLRGYSTPEKRAKHQGAVELWEAITAGAR